MEKNNTESILERDVILVYIDNNPTFFAQIENITPDVKKGWWRVKLIILQIPLMVTIWILDNEQIRGADFTMGGTPIRIEKVVAPAFSPEIEKSEQQESEMETGFKKQARIISLNPNTKNNSG
ncbi:MAG: hypothetical protein JSW07_20330 [bacterium]|nr:MAG: hypothetical protein JSW07_20330 [bacterium]